MDYHKAIDIVLSDARHIKIGSMVIICLIPENQFNL